VVAKKGNLNHNRINLVEDKMKFLELVKLGWDPSEAMVKIGRKSDTLRQWIFRDKAFAADFESARQVAGQLDVDRLGGDKFNIDFSTFSQEYLESKVFPHHQSWVDVVENREPSWVDPAMVYEKGSPRRLLINVPPEHAKSTILTVNYPLYRIAMNPNVQIVIVSQTQTRAKEFLYAIKQRLTEPQWTKMQTVYGPAEGWKDTADQWRDDRIYIKRESERKDPTVQAIGMGQQIYGTRADLIILDDVITTSNAHEWEKQLNWLQKMVITRLGATGMLMIVGTRVASIDLYKELRNPDHWSGGKSPFTYMAMPAVLEFADKPENWRTLWARSDRPWDGAEGELAIPDENGLYPKWDGKQLFERRSEVGAHTWALVYQQQDVEEDAIFPPISVYGSVNKQRRPGLIDPKKVGHPKLSDSTYTIMGLDPAMSGKTGAIMYAVDQRTQMRYVLDVFNMVDPTPGKIRALMEDWIDRYHPNELRIEINAHQKSYALDEELRMWLGSKGVAMRSHFTGKNKWDTSFGVAGMSGLFGTFEDNKHDGNNLIELPSHENNEHVKALINQLITWKADTKSPTDLVMALWFCEIRAKEMLQHGQYQKSHLHNRYASRRSLGQRGSVNLDEWASENIDTLYV
jgi:hypothetical protein